MNKMFISRKLISITAISCITLFCNTNTYATTLKEIVSNENNTIDFTEDIIKQNGNEVTNTINSEEFMVTSNNNVYNTYINTNTLPISDLLGGV